MSDIQVSEVLMAMLNRIEKRMENGGYPQQDPARSKEEDGKFENCGGDSLLIDSLNSTGKRKRCASGIVWKCSHCPKKFRNVSSLRQHSAFHNEDRPFVCTHESGCTKAYKSKSELNRHRISHSNLKAFECHACKTKFMRKQYLKNHILRHPEPGHPQMIRCNWTECSKQFLTQIEAECHILTYHMRPRSRRGSKIVDIVEHNNNIDINEEGNDEQ